MLIEAGVTEDDVLNENLKQKLALRRGGRGRLEPDAESPVETIVERPVPRPQPTPISRSVNSSRNAQLPSTSTVPKVYYGKRNRTDFEDSESSTDGENDDDIEIVHDDNMPVNQEGRIQEPAQKRFAAQPPQDVRQLVSSYLPPPRPEEAEDMEVGESRPVFKRQLPRPPVRAVRQFTPHHVPGIGYKSRSTSRSKAKSKGFVPPPHYKYVAHHPSMTNKAQSRKRVWNRALGHYMSDDDE